MKKERKKPAKKKKCVDYISMYREKPIVWTNQFHDPNCVLPRVQHLYVNMYGAVFTNFHSDVSGSLTWTVFVITQN